MKPGCKSGNKNDKDKKIKTRMVRATGGEFGWVDMEVVDKTSFDGAQWHGPDTGNLKQETIQTRDPERNGNKGNDVFKVRMIGPKKEKAKEVDVRAKKCESFVARNNVERTFENKQCDKPGGNTCRNSGKKDKKDENNAACTVRICFNNIDDEHMDKDTGRIPEDPKKYKDAVTKSKDKVDIFLDVEVPRKFQFRRAKDNKRQEINFLTVHDCKIDMPGSKKLSEKEVKCGETVRLDPFQAVVNFGPDTLAVDFH
jgi:hypothetical protein